MDIVKRHADPLAACHAVVREAFNLWLSYEVRTDDITLICLYIDEAGQGGKEGGLSLEDEEGEEEDPAWAMTTTRPLRSPRGKMPGGFNREGGGGKGERTCVYIPQSRPREVWAA